MFYEKIFREDLRRYFLCDKEYDGSATAANARQKCLHSVFGSLPWGVSSSKFNMFIDFYIQGSWDIENKIERCVDWVKNELNSRKKSPKFY